MRHRQSWEAGGLKCPRHVQRLGVTGEGALPAWQGLIRMSPGSTEWALPRGLGAKSLGAMFLIPFSFAEPEFAAEGRGWGEDGGEQDQG